MPFIYKSICDSKKPDKGFTLIELAVVITIVGVMLALAASFALPIFDTAKRIETEAKLEKIGAAMNQYVAQNYRVPCPADPNLTPAGGEPFGAERGTDANNDGIMEDCGANVGDWSGVIPFQALGLPRDMIFDGYNNPFTYTVSPAFSQDTSDATMLVHPQCRTRDWYYLVSDDYVGTVAVKNRRQLYAHKNPRKARFCCPDLNPNAASDINIQYVRQPYGAQEVINALTFTREADDILAGAGLCPVTGTCSDDEDDPLDPAGAELSCCTPGGYDTTARPFSVAPNVDVPPTDRTTAVIYAIISHGPNGNNAAYNLNNGNRPGTAPANAYEAINADDTDRNFIDIYEKDENYDDILYWRTQDLALASQGQSCVMP